MADRAKKKEKHRLKRAKKQRAVRQASAMTPLQHLSRAPGDLECKISVGWEEQGMASIFVLGTAPDGRHAFAAFLIDIWCVGLKDAYGALRLGREDWDDLIQRANSDSPITKVDPDKARKLIAAAVRFSRQNGFKLPPGWEKWAGMFGVPLDIANADLSKFGKDGGLLYVGTETFLRQHLTGCTVAQFKARPDVHVVTNYGPQIFGGFDDAVEMEDFDDDEEDDEFEDEEEVDDDDDEAIDEMIDQLAPGLSESLGEALEKASAVVAETLRRRNIPPHPRLDEAMGYVTSLSITAKSLQAMGMPPPDNDQCEQAIEELMDLNHEDDPDSLWDAIDQICDVAGFEKMDASEILAGPMPPAC